LPQVNLFPQILTDVVDEESGRAGVRVERKAKRIPQAPRKGFLALLAGIGPAQDAAAGAIRSQERIGGRDISG
jgi:hypothetical protein